MEENSDKMNRSARSRSRSSERLYAGSCEWPPSSESNATSFHSDITGHQDKGKSNETKQYTMEVKLKDVNCRLNFTLIQTNNKLQSY